MKEKKERKTKSNKQEIGFSFFKLFLKKKTNKQIIPESHICKDLNIVKK
jgi:hypothetical protein